MKAVAPRPVLITGGAGFIGSNLADRLASEGCDVLVFDALARPGVERNLAWLEGRHPRRVRRIVADVRDALALRVARERLENVSVRLGAPNDPRLPDASFDRVLMVHMYHEIEQPYEFLWRLRPSLKPDGLVVVVDANRPTQNHGTPPALLKCEFAAVGYVQVATNEMPSAGGYLATFQPQGPRPEPRAIKPCRMS